MGPEIDTRNLAPSPAKAEYAHALHAIAETVSDQLPGAHRIKITAFSGRTGNPSAIAARGARAKTGTWLQHATEHVRAIAPALGLRAMQAPEFRAIAHIPETGSGARVVHLHQLYKDIPIFQAALTVRYDPDGNLIDTVGETISVEHDVPAEPVLSAQEAVLRAARYVVSASLGDAAGRLDTRRHAPQLDLAGFEPAIRGGAGGRERATTLDAGPFAAIEAKLVWFNGADRLVLAWDASLTFPHHVLQYTILVDAEHGGILYCSQLVSHVAAQGNVTRQSGDQPRQMTTFPRPITDYGIPRDSDLPGDFPVDWVANNATVGNSVTSGIVIQNQITAILGTQQGNVLTFDPLDSAVNDRGILNLFYFCCLMHDVSYLLGFREQDGNFQADNFGRLGAPNDPVIAVYWPNGFPLAPGFPPEGAFMNTPPDGQSPRLHASLIAATNRHTAFDATVILHEYTHGITSRLVGGPTVAGTLDAPQSGAMSEGWSDFVACALCQTNVFGSWVFGSPLAKRTAPYDSNYPGHFGNLGVGSYADRYPAGEVWCAALMEMRLRMGDSALALRIVVDALKLTPSNPNFVQARDAMFLALEHMKTAGRITRDTRDSAWQSMWGAFSRFGMGDQATSPDARLGSSNPGFTPPSDAAWKCEKCSGLIGPAGSGPCAAGGNHDVSASPGYALWPQHSDQPPPSHGLLAPPDFGEGNWVPCAKCAGVVVYGDQMGQAVCPGGGFHVPAYPLYRLLPQASAGESDWWRCKKCQGLYFGAAGLAKTCPNGGQHDKDSTKQYSLLPKTAEPARRVISGVAIKAGDWSALVVDTSGFLNMISENVALTAASPDSQKLMGVQPDQQLAYGTDGRRAYFADAVGGLRRYAWTKNSASGGSWGWTSMGNPPAGFNAVAGATDDGTIVVIVGNDGQLWLGTTPPYNPGLWSWEAIPGPNAGTLSALRIYRPIGIHVDVDHTNITALGALAITTDGHVWRVQMNPPPQQWPFTRTWSWADVTRSGPNLTGAVGVNATVPTAFGAAQDGHVWRGSWDDSAKQWSWADGGSPPAGKIVSVIAASDDGAGAALLGDDHHLRLWRTGAASWSDFGTPPGGLSIVRGVGLSATDWKCLVTCSDGHLHLSELNGNWTDLGAPGNWTLFPSPNKWQTKPGAAVDIAIGADGTAWVVGTKTVGDSFATYRWNTGRKDWDDMGGSALRIAVARDGTAWGVDKQGAIQQWTASSGWVTKPGAANDIAAGPDGSIWVVGTKQVGDSFATYRWNTAQNGWDEMGGAALRIAVNRNGTWTVDTQGRISRWINQTWTAVRGRAKDIGAGQDGSVWITLPSGQGVCKWAPEGWLPVIPGDAGQISVDPTGLPWVTGQQNGIFQRIG
jgi:extracellular elastinolytic metalloproteinase